MTIATGPSRLKYLAQAVVALTVTLSLLELGRFSLQPETRINAAFPPSVTLAAQVESAIDALPGAQVAPVRDEFASRLKLRALTCANGYSPAWGTSPDTVRVNIADAGCFTRFDEELARWVGIVRIGPLLAAPPLRPIPKQLDIRTGAPLNGVVFASAAGVAALVHDEAFEIIDLNTQAKILRVTEPEGYIGKFSPNGRLYTLSLGESMEVRKSEDGSLVASFPHTHEHKFYWLDNSTAVYVEAEADAARLIDFVTLKEVELPEIDDLGGVLPVPGEPRQFVVAHSMQASKFELDRSAALPQLRLLKITRHSSFGSWSTNATSPTTDGRHYVSHTSRLEILTLDSLRQESIDLGQYWAQMTLGTSDPDLVFLAGVMKAEKAGDRRCYLYSISRRSFAAIDCDRDQRPIFIRSLGKLAFITKTGVDVVDDMGELVMVPHFDQVRAWHEEHVRSQEGQAQAQQLALSESRSRWEAAQRAEVRTVSRGPEDGSSVLYKCLQPDGSSAFQGTPCPPGKEIQQLTVKQPPGSGSRASEGDRYRDPRLQRWLDARGRSAPTSPARTSPTAPFVPALPEFRYVPPEITQPEDAPPPTAAARQRCPYTPVKGRDDELEGEKVTLYTQLFYIDFWSDSSAMLGAPAAGEDRRDEEARRARCDVVADEYEMVGAELLRVYPKSLPGLRACFQREAQRLRAEALRKGCNFWGKGRARK